MLASGPVSAESTKARNVILFIGDGMGPQQLGLLSMYAHLAEECEVPDRLPAIERVIQGGTLALVRTDTSGLVADSAAAATQLATGKPAGSEMIGIDAEGNAAETVVERAKRLGKSAGLVTDTRITHATPAAFAAHQRHRTMENEIAVDILENRVDVLMGGGLRNWVPADAASEGPTQDSVRQLTGWTGRITSKRQDNRNLLLEARQAGYSLVFDRESMAAGTPGPLLGLFAVSEMQDAMTERAQRDSHGRTQPTLAEMTAAAIDALSVDPDGFFLLIEGGQIDWAGHNNDAGTLLHELLRFDRAVRVAYEWAKNRDDTLVVVTADHETGGFGFSYSGTGIPNPKPLPGKAFAGELHRPLFNFGSRESLALIYDQKQSFFQVFMAFDALDEAEQTPSSLAKLANAALPVDITEAEAERILRRTENRQYVEGHRYLGTETVPDIYGGIPEFFVYGENLRMNNLGHILGPRQSITWSTGSHTSTPVPLAACGPAEAQAKFHGLMHATEVGQALMEIVSE